MGFILLRVGNRGSEKTLFVQSALSHNRIIHKFANTPHKITNTNTQTYEIKHETTRPVFLFKIRP